MVGIGKSFQSAQQSLLAGLQRSSQMLSGAAGEIAEFGTVDTPGNSKGLAESIVDFKVAAQGYEANARALSAVDRVSRSLLAIID